MQSRVAQQRRPVPSEPTPMQMFALHTWLSSQSAVV
jgi:hypothetical protein